MASNRPPPSRIPVHRSPTAAATTIHRNTLISDVLPNTADPTSDEKPGNHSKKLTEMSVRFSPSTSMVYASSMFSQSGSLQALKQRREELRDLRPSTDLRPLTNIIQVRSAPSTPSFDSSRLRPGDASSSAKSSSSLLLDEEPLSSLFSPPESPTRNLSDSDFSPVEKIPHSSVRARHQHLLRRKTVPVYTSEDSDCSSSASSAAEPYDVVQNVGPNVFIAYDEVPVYPLIPAFTHIVRVVPMGSAGRSRMEETFDKETGVHTLHLPIDPPGAASPKFKIQRKAVPLFVPPAFAVTSPVVFENKKGNSDPAPVGLQHRQIAAVLAFVRPQPSAANARRRVLVLTPRGHLAREGLALIACYLACAERCGVKSVLHKFESSESEVSHPWRGLLGEEGVVGAYLEEMLNSR